MYLRTTPTKERIYKIIQKSEQPVSAQEILSQLEEKGHSVNKTTVYRELETLLKHGEVTELDFGDGKKHYELKESGHHHHLICRKCNKVAHVDLSELEKNLAKAERKISKQEDFKVTNHSLELFGLCGGCQ